MVPNTALLTLPRIIAESTQRQSDIYVPRVIDFREIYNVEINFINKYYKKPFNFTKYKYSFQIEYSS